MKRLLWPVLIVAVAITTFLFRAQWLPQPPGQNSYLGYVEGETAMIGGPVAGRPASVDVEKGQRVTAGEVLFALDPAQAIADAARAKAALATAKASYSNLLSGKRPQAIDVIRAQIAPAGASLALAQKELQRASTLASSGIAALSRLDQAQDQVTLYEQRLAELKASEHVAALPASPAEREAAASHIAEAEALLQREEVQFIITIPAGLTQKLVRGERPQIAIESDATDSATTGPALGAAAEAMTQTLERELTRPLTAVRPQQGPVDLILHKRYNPEEITRYNIEPSLLEQQAIKPVPSFSPSPLRGGQGWGPDAADDLCMNQVTYTNSCRRSDPHPWSLPTRGRETAN